MELLSRPSQSSPWGFDISVGHKVTNASSIIKYAELMITSRCEGACITCPLPAGPHIEKQQGKDINLKNELSRLKEIILILKTLGLEVLTIYGKEPLLWDMEEGNLLLMELIAWASKEKDIRICLCTSGLNLNQKVFRTLFEHQGILFMKDWGGERSVNRLMKAKNAYSRIKASWDNVQSLRKDFAKTTVIAEFLYTGINRGDLLDFWKACLSNQYIPFVETPVISGACIKNYPSLKIDSFDYVRDIYNLSLNHLSMLYHIPHDDLKNSDMWEPPFGSVFPISCDKLTRGKGIFVDLEGNLSICSGVPVRIGNIFDNNISGALQDSSVLRTTRNLYLELTGKCGECQYSKDLKICYGCRGHAFSYPSPHRGLSCDDPMCFGLCAKKAGYKRLKTFMAKKHIDKILDYFPN